LQIDNCKLQIVGSYHWFERRRAFWVAVATDWPMMLHSWSASSCTDNSSGFTKFAPNQFAIINLQFAIAFAL
jgi:hypothetical protein